MKRFLATILTVLYLATSVSATVRLHYCMGKLRSASLVRSNNVACNICKVKSSEHSCCKDVYKVIKAVDTHVYSNIVFHVVKGQYDLGQISYPFLSCSLITWNKNVYINTHAPPDKVISGCPIYIKVRNFRV